MIAIDPESRRIVRLEINKARAELVANLPEGIYYDANGTFKPQLFEFNRGRIQGMKDVLELLETQPETLSDGNDDESDAA